MQVNGRRTQAEPEFELFDALRDTFLTNRYFDVFIEYAKADSEDILCRIMAINRGPDPSPIHSRNCRVGSWNHTFVADSFEKRDDFRIVRKFL
ncbi:MAG TPA: hypothetical protein VGR30_20095 [Candidatus Binatia bacterium]|jgi:hypothetical protein|nr:hypothetical protein [Candidatus Binatia bacterium]